MTRRTILIGFFALLAVFLLNTGIASANFGIHGNYLADTDRCAACHRSHTASSQMSWSDPWGSEPNKNALLISEAQTTRGFCETCHGDAAIGASTDVVNGVFVARTYRPTESDGKIGAVLNGGGFSAMGGRHTTSSHNIDGSAGTSWGAGQTGPGTSIALDCSSCHDVHGTSNYRLLKDTVNGHVVGGYAGNASTEVNPQPQAWVKSGEIGFPSTGFRLRTSYDGSYVPNYTTGRYQSSDRGISSWCVACHEQYATESSTYDPGDGTGDKVHYRHPINVPLSNWFAGGDLNKPLGTRSLVMNPNAWSGSGSAYVDLPLEHDPRDGNGPVGSQTNGPNDRISCLTCHRAHGSSAMMSGYANSSNSTAPQPDSGSGGVAPSGDSALLRADNRGVCERCHNK